MLDAKGDADDRDEAGQGTAEVTQGQPPAGHQESHHISDHPQGARSQVASSPQVTAVDRFGAERPEGETTDHPARSRPGQTNDGDGADQCGNPPGQGHGQSTKDNPEKVEDQGNHVSIVTAGPMSVR